MTVTTAADNAVESRDDAVASADAAVGFIFVDFPLGAIDLRGTRRRGVRHGECSEQVIIRVGSSPARPLSKRAQGTDGFAKDSFDEDRQRPMSIDSIKERLPGETCVVVASSSSSAAGLGKGGKEPGKYGANSRNTLRCAWRLHTPQEADFTGAVMPWIASLHGPPGAKSGGVPAC